MLFSEKLVALGFETYNDYLNGDHWRDFRRRHREAGRTRCAVCGDKKIDLHHHSYDRLGNESFDDITPLCPDHHNRVHAILKENKWHVAKTGRVVKRLIAELNPTPVVVAVVRPKKPKQPKKKSNKALRRQMRREERKRQEKILACNIKPVNPLVKKERDRKLPGGYYVIRAHVKNDMEMFRSVALQIKAHEQVKGNDLGRRLERLLGAEPCQFLKLPTGRDSEAELFDQIQPVRSFADLVLDEKIVSSVGSGKYLGSA